MSAPLRVSIVVPALNEAAGIGATLARFRPLAAPWDVAVVDGGSTDGTRDAVRQALPEARWIEAPPGRARQMNVGAAATSGDVLLFVHADTQLPPDALDYVRRALLAPHTVAGCFRTTFDVGAAGFGPIGAAAMRVWQGRLWMRWHRLAFGDRALFVRREAFEAAGGFPDQPVFEDLDLVRALRPLGRFAFLDAGVVTSARRFRKHGAIRQQARNLSLWLGWWVGVPPHRLKRFYSDAPEQRG